MTWLHDFATTLWQLSLAMAPYILLGLLIAGLLHELVPESLITKHLGKRSVGSVVKATLFGIPLPVCSCGVVPLAASLKSSGASNGATLAFLISTPITGADSVLATYGIFGWLFTLYRLVTSVIIALIAGIAVNLTGTPPPKPLFGATPSFEENDTAACCASGSCCDAPSVRSHRFSLKAALRYGFVTLLDDIAGALILGLVLGALITVLVPEDMSALMREYEALSYLVALGVALPMYVCATASLPIAAALMLSGISAGAAFVFLTAGPATNTVTMGVVKSMLGTRALVIYLLTLVIGSILFGIILDMLFARIGIDAASLIHTDDEYGIVAYLSAVALWGWMAGRKAIITMHT